MIITSDKTLKNGTRRVTVTLSKGETLQAIDPGKFYRLGDPMDDVVAGYILTHPNRVAWCSIEQKWVD